MTDNEIIEALECCRGGYGVRNCDDCSMQGKTGCIEALPEFALDLINRQKAEIRWLNSKLSAKDSVNSYNVARLRIAIEELNKYPIKTIVSNNCEIHSKTSKDYDNLMADIKSEAIKEFAERLKENMRLEDDCDYDCENCFYDCNKYVLTIDNLVKEMTEETSDNK